MNIPKNPAAKTKTSLREVNKQRAKEAILKAASDLIAEHGYEFVTITQIADAAGIARRTFFNYFASKDEVMFSRAHEYGEFILTKIREQRPGMDADENFEHTLLAFAKKWESDRTHIGNITKVYYEVPALRVRMYGLVLEWQERWALELQRVYKAPVSDRYIYRSIVASGNGVFMSTLHAWATDVEHASLSKAVAKSLRILKEGWSANVAKTARTA